MPRVVSASLAMAVALAWLWSPVSGQGAGQPSTSKGEWPHYTADLRGSTVFAARSDRRVELQQADRRVAVQDRQPRPVPRVQARRHAADGQRRSVHHRRHAPGGGRARRRRPARSIWVHSLREGKRAAVSPRQLSGRGVSYWTDGRGDERILYVDHRLPPGRARTRRPARRSVVRHQRHRRSEGRRGEGHAARRSISRPARSASTRRRSSPETSSIIGSAMREGATVETHDNTKGLVRAFDVRTGKQLWQFNTIPRPGAVRQRHLAERIVGHQRQRRRLDADHRRRRARPRLPAGRNTLVGLLRRPSSGQQPVRREPRVRRSENRAAQVALPVRASPDLELRHVVGAAARRRRRSTARPDKVVAVPSKQAWLYVFDRVTGRPVWPIEEKPVPTGDVPGEMVSPTQPHPTEQAAVRAQLPERADDLIDFTPELRAASDSSG